MTFSLLWLPQVLRDAGLSVTEVPGWQNRGHGDEGNVLGIICHHTCGPLHGEMLDLNVIVEGRPDLGGPLAQLALGRTGIFHVVAAGKCWHAGRGAWKGITDGNAHFIGIEAENTGETKGPLADPWPAVQVDAYERGCAAILRHIKASVDMCIGHKEWALPKGRKDDPSFDMVKFRQGVAAIMAGDSAIAGEPAPQPPLAAPQKFGTVSAVFLNVRAAPNTQSAVVRRMMKGDRVVIVDEVGDAAWLKVADGYVSAKFVDVA